MTSQAVKLELKFRDILGKKVKQLRREGTTPVHLYGPEIESRPLQCDQRELLRALSRAGGNTPIMVAVEGEQDERLTFARELQWHPTRGELLHVDFIAVQATLRMSAQVPISLIGESPGAREAGGTAIQQLRELQVEALPLEIPHEIEIDLAQLVDPNGIIRAGDIQLPPNVSMLTDAEDVVVRIEITRAVETFPVGEAADGEAPAAGVTPAEPGEGNAG